MTTLQAGYVLYLTHHNHHRLHLGLKWFVLVTYEISESGVENLQLVAILKVCEETLDGTTILAIELLNRNSL